MVNRLFLWCLYFLAILAVHSSVMTPLKCAFKVIDLSKWFLIPVELVFAFDSVRQWSCVFQDNQTVIQWFLMFFRNPRKTLESLTIVPWTLISVRKIELKMMLATHAPVTPIRIAISSKLTTIFLLSQSSSSKSLDSLNFHRRRRSYRLIASMAEKSHQEHVTEKWFSIPELRLRNHRFTVPLDYNSQNPQNSPKITIFAREIVAVGKEEEQAMPYLLYLQGGPGFESPRPNESSGWIQRACEEFRVILLDQRGTGLSTPLTSSSMLQFKTPKNLADYLVHFRADNIVKDAEFIRVHLVPNADPWTILGQSFGGFCAITYLSFAPKGLKQVLITGGIPPVGKECTADDVYEAGFEQVIRQNEKYYERFPEDVEIVREIVNHLAESESGGVLLPSGGILTPKGLQALGLSGLGSSTGFERLHYMFERVWDPILVPGAPKRISRFFLTAFENWHSFDTNPLYALLHESIYCEGASSRWSAHRLREKFDCKFDAIKAAKESQNVLFTGEMIFPWMFDEIHALKPFKEAADLLAKKEDWPRLYDVDTLNNNKVPVAAAVYYEDMYVNFKLVMETTKKISGIRVWVTNEFMHSGLRDSGRQVIDHLLGMINGKKPLF